MTITEISSDISIGMRAIINVNEFEQVNQCQSTSVIIVSHWTIKY